jgi:methylglutaconyl-CoA hydratase
MIAQLGEALDDLYYEKRVRAIVLVGAGDVFCIGADVAEMQATQESEESGREWGAEASEFRDLLVRMLEITKPIIAGVVGPALGAAAALVAACDLVVAGPGATFGLPEARHGVVAGLAAPLVGFRVGAGPAARLMLTGSPLAAAEAHRLGMFHEVVADDAVYARALELAGECAAGAPEAIQLSKRLLNETLGESLATQLSAGAASAATSRTTEAAEEGIAAQLGGRPPVWK